MIVEFVEVVRLAAAETLAFAAIIGAATSIYGATKKPPKPPTPVNLPTSITSAYEAGKDIRKREAGRGGRASTILTGASSLLEEVDPLDGSLGE